MERIARVPVTRIRGDERESANDVLVVEEPLEIRLVVNAIDKPVSVTMRTPGEDFALAAGFLFTESIVRDAGEIDSIRHWGSPNVVRVALRETVRVDLVRLQRHFYSTSSCGVCGKTSIDALRVKVPPIESNVRVTAAAIERMPDALRERQIAFDATGAIHGAAIFSAEGTLLRVAEDVGRHNAVDKVIGARFLEGGDADVLVVSGRTSFEIVQKCVVARIPVLAAVGAPSSLAVDLAHEFNLTLLGFVRDGRFNVYAGGERVG